MPELIGAVVLTLGLTLYVVWNAGHWHATRALQEDPTPKFDLNQLKYATSSQEPEEEHDDD